MRIAKISAETTGKPPKDGFLQDRRGGVAMQAALVFGAVGLAMALFAPPVLENATTRLADVRQQGVDATTTGSVKAGGRYTIRMSVLSASPQVVCGARVARNCLPDGR